MADCIAKTLLWFPKLAACSSVSDIRACLPTEARRMVCLALLYFPELKNEVGDYSNGLTKHYHWTIDCFDPNFPASAGAQTVRQPDCKERTNEMTLLRQRLDNAIEKGAKKYTPA